VELRAVCMSCFRDARAAAESRRHAERRPSSKCYPSAGLLMNPKLLYGMSPRGPAPLVIREIGRVIWS